MKILAAAPAVLVALLLLLSARVQAQDELPQASIRVDPGEVEYGQTLSIVVTGTNNTTLRVWILYLGLRSVERYNVTLVNGTSLRSIFIACSLEDVLDDTCAWQPGRYTALVTSLDDEIVNRTTFRVKFTEEMMWALVSGSVRLSHEDQEANQLVLWDTFWLTRLGEAGVMAVLFVLIWIEVTAPVNLPEKILLHLGRAPRWFLRFLFGHAVPRNYNAAVFPHLAHGEVVSSNVQIYTGIADKYGTRAERMELRARRLREAETWARRGADKWSKRADLEEGADG